MLDLINEERTSRGLDPLRLEKRLNDSSEDHSRWMDQTETFSHTGVNGSSSGDRMRDAGFQFTGNWYSGENIAWQSVRGEPGIADDVVDMHNSLMNSPGHRANILSPNFEVIGIGIETGNFQGYDSAIVTQNFARTAAPLQIDTGGTQPPNTPNPPNPTNGNDVLVGGNGNDRMDGGAGNDVLRGQNGNDNLLGGNGRDNLQGGEGRDTLFGGNNFDTLHGGGDNDRLNGGTGADRLNGANGNDSLMGAKGNDHLSGGAGNDVMVGGEGRDTLDGGLGRDVLAGGAGDDVFIFSQGRDTVRDFNVASRSEIINLRTTSEITSFRDLKTDGHLRQVGDHAVIDDKDGNTMTLLNVDIDALQANDFLF